MKTILSIDDDPNELAVMDSLFTSAGYKHLAADDGETGINCAIFAQPDLILLDVCMTGLDGFEVCQLLRKNKRTKDIPIVFKTCLDSVDAVILGIESGLDDFVVKPCNHDELLKRVEAKIGTTRRDNVQALLDAASLSNSSSIAKESLIM